MGFAGEGRPEIEHFGRHFVAEENVLSGMGLLLPARGLRVPLGVGGTLPAALRPVKRGCWGAFQLMHTVKNNLIVDVKERLVRHLSRARMRAVGTTNASVMRKRIRFLQAVCCCKTPGFRC
jgi:hypothetical protein